jgi:hypothetical protein
MSIVITYVSDVISIIATDSRVSYGKHNEFGFSDNNEKLHNLPLMGWYAGVGLHDFLELFKEKIEVLNITDTDKIVSVYKQTLEEFENQKPLSLKYINRSVLACSWIGFSEVKGVLMRVGFLSKDHFNDDIALLGKNKIHILYPIEYIENPQIAMSFEENNLMTHDFDNNLYSIFTKILNMFHSIVPTTQCISTICDIGVQCLTKEGLYKLRIRGDVEMLLEKLAQNDFDSQISLVDFKSF